MTTSENIKKYSISTVALTSLTVGSIFLFRKKTGKKIVEEAQKFIGIREIQPNAGWTNKYFEALMKKVGWKKPQAYCVLFTKMVLLNVLKGKQKHFVAKIFNASSQTTWANLIKNQSTGLYKLSKTPKLGSIAIYKHMQRNWQGHGDIVTSFNKNDFKVISANESRGVEVKTRKYTFKSNTFRLLGFVNF